MKKVFANYLMIICLLSAFILNASADDNINVYVNENLLQCDAAPFIENGRTMVPMRKIFEALNAEVNWEEATKTITATRDNTEIKLQINNSTMYNNGSAEALDAEPVIVDGTTFVPVRAVSQCLNASVEWSDADRSVYITYPTKHMMTTQEFDSGMAKGISYFNNGMYYEARDEFQWFCDDNWGNMNSGQQQYALGYLDGSKEKIAQLQKQEAAAKAAASRNYQSSSQSSNYSIGNAVYRTPYGKKYHFRSTCGGKNSYQITLAAAKSAGLTPCSKCAN